MFSNYETIATAQTQLTIDTRRLAYFFYVDTALSVSQGSSS
jgi:hypothetical protein